VDDLVVLVLEVLFVLFVFLVNEKIKMSITKRTPPPIIKSLGRLGLIGPGKLAGFERLGDGETTPVDPTGGGGGEIGTGPGREN
jgi:hypothetical protein